MKLFCCFKKDKGITILKCTEKGCNNFATQKSQTFKNVVNYSRYCLIHQI